MALNTFDVPTTRRLSIGIMSVSGALLFATLNLIGVGIAAGDSELVEELSIPKVFLAVSAFFGLLSFICAELAAHESTPAVGHPHSKRNYLESAFAYLAVCALIPLLVGGLMLITAV